MPGEESRHNLVYWRYGEYVGLGPGAHGREVRRDRHGHGKTVRIATVNEKSPEAWTARVNAQGWGALEETELTRAEQADEVLLMGLRLAEGVDLDHLAALGDVRPSQAVIDKLSALGMLEAPCKGRLKATRAGRFVLNELVRQLSGSFEAVE